MSDRSINQRVAFLTWEVIIGLSSLLCHEEREMIQIPVIDEVGACLLPQVLIEPIECSDYEVGAIEMLLNFDLESN